MKSRTSNNNSPPHGALKPTHPTFLQATAYWLKLGFISFGGPAGQIAIMHQDLVDKKRWISEKRFLHALGYCMALPGPEAQQLAVYVGWLLHKGPGGLVAGTLFILPSLFLLVGLSYIYMAFGHLAAIQGIFSGVKPAVVALVLFAAVRIGGRTLKNPVLWAVAAGAFAALYLFQVPFPFVVLGAGLAGIAGGKWWPKFFSQTKSHPKGVAPQGPALIDDETPTPPHAQFKWKAFARVAVVALGLWGALTLGLHVAGYPVLRDMGTFFSKAALVTFGGAYAVLPYVNQAAVGTYHWLAAGQVIDGLALGETTPGPLIMVVTFIGFVGAYTHQVFGPGHLFLSGAAGALVATVFTFLPSFVFILAGGPFVEGTRGNLKFTAPLTCVTAAVVGVILNLTLLFGHHVLFPGATAAHPFAGGLSLFAALLALGAFVALWRFKMNVMAVIGVCAALGLVRLLFLSHF